MFERGVINSLVLKVASRCNLSCTYCNEYDDYSKPIPLDTIRERIDHLAKGTDRLESQLG